MKRNLTFVTIVALAIALPGMAAAEGDATFTSDMMQNFDATFQKIIQLAEAAPEDKFSWAPSAEVRTLSEVYMHAVGVNLVLPMALGAAPSENLEIPEGGPFAALAMLEKNYTTKDEVVAQLKASFEYASAAVPTIMDHETEVNIFGFPGTKRAYLLIWMGHANEHLGQAIAYSRSVGIVPPWSQPAGGDGGR
jgi:uncharacterized damage-inducible protein DinB